MLDAKARKLLSPRSRQNEERLPFPEIFQKRTADVFVAYCSNAVATARARPGVTFERIPALLNVAAIYGIGVPTKSPPAADAFVTCAIGNNSRRIFARYGLR